MYAEIAITLKKGVDRAPSVLQYLGRFGLLTEFYRWVNHNACWDIKRKGPWEATIKTPYPGKDKIVIYRGIYMTPENLGNYTYGYLGAAFGFSYDVLVTGSWYAAGLPGGGARLRNELDDQRYILEGYLNFWY